MSRTDEEIFRLWRVYEASVARLVREIGDDDPLTPLKALEHGLAIGAPVDSHEPPQAAVMRAAAQKIIPDAFEWEVLVAVGGRCFLTLKSYRPERDDNIG